MVERKVERGSTFLSSPITRSDAVRRIGSESRSDQAVEPLFRSQRRHSLLTWCSGGVARALTSHLSVTLAALEMVGCRVERAHSTRVMSI